LSKPALIWSAVVWLAMLGTPLFALAGDNPEYRTLEPITLDECIKIALRDNPEFLSYKENLSFYVADETRAQREMFPDFSLDWTGTESNKDIGVYHTYGKVTQPIYRGKALHTQWKLAGMDREKARLELLRQAQLKVFEVKRTWYRLLEARAIEAEAARSLDRLRQHAANAARFFEEGMIWRTDVLQADVEVAQGDQDLVVAKNETAKTLTKLNTLLNRDVTTPVISEGKLEIPEFNESYEQLVALALARRPDLAQTNIDLERSKKNAQLSRSNRRPAVDVEGKYGLLSDEVGMNSNTEVGSIGFSASWNFYSSGKNEMAITAAKARVRQAHFNLEKTKANLILSVQDSWLSVLEAQKRTDVMAKALAQSRENYRVNQIRYTERLGTAKEVLDAQELMTRTQRDHIRGIADYLVALAQLDFAVGRENPLADTEQKP
jgi:outer membrane protein